MTQAKSLFPRSSFVGFDHLLNELDNLTRHASDTYPPHNIVKLTDGDNDFLVEVAVAGFTEDELSVEVEERTLTIKGDHFVKGREYIHKGISTKKFSRNFRLSEYVEVVGAKLNAGILSVHLKVRLPEEKRPRQIAIEKTEDNHETIKKHI